MPKRTDMRTPRLVGASVLPFTRAPGGELYWILGRERRVGRWSDSNTWCDFGGRKEIREDGSDETLCVTAARECHEEMMGLLRYSDGETAIPHDDSTSFCNWLMEGNFHTLMLFSQADGATYGTFVIEVPWQPEITELFERVHERLQSLYYASLGSDFTMPDTETHPATRGGRVALPYLEKTSCRMFSTPEICRAFDMGILVRRYNGRDEGLRNGFRARIFVALKQLGVVPAGWSPLTNEPVPRNRMMWTPGDGDTDITQLRLTNHVRAALTLEDPEREEFALLLAPDFS